MVMPSQNAVVVSMGYTPSPMAASQVGPLYDAVCGPLGACDTMTSGGALVASSTALMLMVSSVVVHALAGV